MRLPRRRGVGRHLGRQLGRASENLATQAAMDLDLKSGPATIICLQEAHEGVVDVLAMKPAHRLYVANYGGENRPQFEYHTLRAKENAEKRTSSL